MVCAQQDAWGPLQADATEGKSFIVRGARCEAGDAPSERAYNLVFKCAPAPLCLPSLLRYSNAPPGQFCLDDHLQGAPCTAHAESRVPACYLMMPLWLW